MPGQPGRQSAEGGNVSGLVGGGPSQVGVDGAMRARDVSRPRAEDLTRAEETVQVSRRSYRSGGAPAPADPGKARAKPGPPPAVAGPLLPKPGAPIRQADGGGSSGKEPESS